jgi:Zn finger protein HypA/HybF involved in hydrogenase expression
MGASVAASCPCGYSTEMMIGGLKGYPRLCLFPAYCEECEVLLPVNLVDTPIICPGCQKSRVMPYYADRLQGEPGTRIVASCGTAEEQPREFELTDGTYLCPACKRTTLRFVQK